MKIAIISTYGNDYGAGKAIVRIHMQLREAGIKSHLYLLEDSHKDIPDTTILGDSFLGKIRLRQYRKKVRDELRHATIRSVFSINQIGNPLLQIDELNKADLILLGWTGNGMISHSQIKMLKPPIVWRVSDSWQFTGGCHLPGNCTNYEINCYPCPQAENESRNNIAAQNLRCKIDCLKNKNVTYWFASKWMHNRFLHSAFAKETSHQVLTIPTGVNTKIFNPGNKQEAKQELGLNPAKFTISFGAVNPTDNHKGYQFIKDQLGQINENEFEILTFGNSHYDFFHDFNCKVINLGRVNSDAKLVSVYRSADVFIAPYLYDNLPNTVLEAMACGCPVIAFNAGGVPEVISHNKNGILLNPANADFLDAVISIKKNKLTEAPEKVILEFFDLEKNTTLLVQQLRNLVLEDL